MITLDYIILPIPFRRKQCIFQGVIAINSPNKEINDRGVVANESESGKSKDRMI